MTFDLRSGASALLFLGLVAVPARAGEAENLQRLESLPRTQRLRLAEDLDRFDRLEPGQRQEVRQLDQRLADLPPSERQRYQKLMHRYHLWFQGLEPAQQQELQAAPAQKRLDLIKRFRVEQRQTQAEARRIDSVWIRSAVFNRDSPLEVAYLIKVWLALEPQERAEIEKLELPARVQRLERIGQDRGIAKERPADLEELKRRIESGQPLREGPHSRKELEELKRQVEAVTGLKSLAPFKKAQTRSAALRRLETNYFWTHEPEPVDSQKLSRFEAALPSWLDEMIDPLPPEVARRKLSILYRLVFPHPREMPEPKPEKPGAKPAGPGATSPTTPSPAESSPF